MPDKLPKHLAAGAICEDIALEHMQSQGLKIIERNFNCRLGELDLIMRSESCLIIAEVRYRKSLNFGGAAATIDHTKQQRIIKTTQIYLQKHPQYKKLPVRFDVIAMSGELSEPEIQWLKNAFGASNTI
ncbi:MAG: YraN family protein [Gammaproteobacteria bacterium]|jgi:putative endonuclease|nr:YraN family protein [Gammaproteobacteria bacterium]